MLWLQGHLIKEYFVNYSLHQSDVTFELEKIMLLFIVIDQNHGPLLW